MKLDALLPAQNADVPQGGWTELRSRQDERSLQSCVVQAHQELANVPGPTGESFHDIAAALTKELEAKEGRDN